MEASERSVAFKSANDSNNFVRYLNAKNEQFFPSSRRIKKRARKLNVVSEDEISRMGRDRSGNREEGTKAIRIFDEYSSRLWGGGRIEN